MMVGEGQLVQFRKRWQRILYLECLCYALGFGALAYLVSWNILVTIAVFVLAFLVALYFYRPWNLQMESAVAYIDAHVPEAAYSSGLLAISTEELSDLSKLQQHKVYSQLRTILPKLNPPHKLIASISVMLGLVLIGFAVHFGVKTYGKHLVEPSTESQIQFTPLDTLANTVQAPELKETSIAVNYPDYTQLATLKTWNPNISAVVGSVVTWTLVFEGEVTSIDMERMGDVFSLSKVNGQYTLSQKVEASGFYSFNFKDVEGNAYTTDLYSLEAIKDIPPVIEVDELPQYSYFEYGSAKEILLKAKATDDFGVDDAYIVATVSKGSGESVKFREETIRFDGTFSKGSKKLDLRKQLDLDQLGMDPGDELYFYVEALDNKVPNANISRSETYFAVIRDTVSDGFAVEGTLGVDLMPDYFRSQRQLIIDTEKLIKDRPNLSEYQFKFKSNELGFDQKSLRLKYGQFMGDEAEMQAAPGAVTHTESEEDHDHDHDHEEGEEDLLEGYSHRHDSDNEHNLVPESDHDHGHEEENGEEAEDPLHDYLHNHDNPEESTLFEKSVKDKLREALNIMWDAELYLRLYEPKSSLPYQYKALELIQEIKNSARIYVHRIGYDPPPIKEEKRLTGDIKAITNYDKKEQFDHTMSFASTRQAISRLELLSLGRTTFKETDRALFQEAGNELAQKAVDEPLKYLKVLRGLRDFDKAEERTPEKFREVQKNLLSVITEVEGNPGKKTGLEDEINVLYLKELGNYD
ncbi:MAG: tryptophan-rich sensory protein [Flavobacteriia bacterium]|nr:MAG: tryptophan-rich sensory protein [Flavobacteriia bacterium]